MDVRVKELDDRKRNMVKLVVKGFQLKERINYNEIFSSVFKMTTIQVALCIVVAENLHFEQMDVKTMFLHIDL